MRQQKRLTQEHLADLSGFSQQYISGLERGERNPTVVTLYELARALGVNHVDLIKPDDGREISKSRRRRPDRRQDLP